MENLDERHVIRDSKLRKRGAAAAVNQNFDKATQNSVLSNTKGKNSSLASSATTKSVITTEATKRDKRPAALSAKLQNMTTKAKIMTDVVENCTTSMIKRSLSESSADEFYRSGETAARNGLSSRKMWQNELLVNPNGMGGQRLQRQLHKTNELNGGGNNNVSSGKEKHKNKNHFISDIIDVGIRVILVIVFVRLETTTAFHRNIHVEELWLYKNPRTPDFVTPTVLIGSVIIFPFLTTLLHLFLTKDRRDFRAANWTWTLCLCLNGLTTSLLKITSGRPRPDFFYRCFPEGELIANVTPTAVNFNCTGKWRDINEGYKSFPSGHSSFAFASFGFIAFYLSGKLHTFNPVGRGETWRLCISVAPLLISALVGVSRTCDYHHHWQDVFAGSVIGLFIAYLIYRQYYPSIFSRHSHRAFPRDSRGASRNSNAFYKYKQFRNDDSDDALVGNTDAIHTNRRSASGDDEFRGSDEQLSLLPDDDDNFTALTK